MSNRISKISLGLNVRERMWFVVDNKFLPKVEKSLDIGTPIYKEKDAKSLIKMGYKIIEIDWCKLQTIIGQMRVYNNGK